MCYCSQYSKTSPLVRIFIHETKPIVHRWTNNNSLIQVNYKIRNSYENAALGHKPRNFNTSTTRQSMTRDDCPIKLCLLAKSHSGKI